MRRAVCYVVARGGLPFPAGGRGGGKGTVKSQARTQKDAWVRFFMSPNPRVAPRKRDCGFADATRAARKAAAHAASFITPALPAAHSRTQKLPCGHLSEFCNSHKVAQQKKYTQRSHYESYSLNELIILTNKPAQDPPNVRNHAGSRFRRGQPHLFFLPCLIPG